MTTIAILISLGTIANIFFDAGLAVTAYRGPVEGSELQIGKARPPGNYTVIEDSFTIKVTRADDLVIILINGEFARAVSQHGKSDDVPSYDVYSRLKRGQNEVSVLAINYDYEAAAIFEVMYDDELYDVIEETKDRGDTGLFYEETYKVFKH